MPGVGRIRIPGGGGAVLPVPMTISGLVAWYDATKGVTKDGSNRVSAWADQYGSNNLAQSTGGNQPLYEATGLNGLPCITFANARPDRLEGSGGTLCSTVSGDDQPYTVITALAPVTTTGTESFWAWNNASNANVRVMLYKNGSLQRVAQFRKDDAGSAATPAGAGNATTDAIVVAWTFPGTTGTVHINGTAVLSAQALNVNTVTADIFTLAAERIAGTPGLPQSLKVSEWLLYDGALSDTNRQSLEAYLTTRWTIT